ncbi:hypothetical protein GCM10010912_68820 [Paenibacillus albidus]|uniref:Uncharacterized protein n=1 Tax=Paenibacillus albidus TaxID=2041023 RepID=A0A917LCY0_9BACL|nr:hypothetical protein GCM10010912_68820 [Paenibacillus albidus]
MPQTNVSRFRLGYTSDVDGQEHSPIKTRVQYGFFFLRDQVLVLSSGQELDPIAEIGQELGTIGD